MEQKIFVGAERFEEVFASFSQRKIMLVCGKSFESLPASVRDACYALKDIVAVFSEFAPNPTYEQVADGVRVFNEKNCDAILAVGGGSCIDVAKCIKLFCVMNHSVNYMQQEYRESGVPLVAVPTTAGTGSESTRFAVIYHDGKKQSVTHDSIVPNYVILESSVLKSLPVNQKKATMLDALCQAIEAWWSVNSTNESKRYSKSAVDAIVKHYKAYIFDNDDVAARNIMTASNYAGRAINITQTTAAHAMSYKLTSMYNLPHGQAVAVCFPTVWQYMISHVNDCIDPRGQEYLANVFSEIPVGVQWFESLLRELNIEGPTADDREKEIDILTRSVNAERLKNTPIYLDEKTLKKMYERIVK